MTVLYFLVLAVVSIPMGVLAIGYFHAKHHHRSHDAGDLRARLVE